MTSCFPRLPLLFSSFIKVPPKEKKVEPVEVPEYDPNDDNTYVRIVLTFICEQNTIRSSL